MNRTPRAGRVPASTLIALAGLMAFGGCSREEEAVATGWRVVPETSLSASQQGQSAAAAAARDALFANLMQRLMQVTMSEGPVEAVAVCREEAPKIAAEVAGRHGVRIGRTSFRLRNPDNAPPDWAGDLIARRVEDPTFLEGPGGELGAFLPIRLMDFCAACHGPTDAIAPAVLEEIATHYPADEATGFAVGELRGWFWVEVPADGT